MKTWAHVQVVAVTAVRTGAGKSQVSAYVNTVLHEHRLKTVLVRHPMPYGGLPLHALLYCTYLLSILVAACEAVGCRNRVIPPHMSWTDINVPSALSRIFCLEIKSKVRRIL